MTVASDRRTTMQGRQLIAMLGYAGLVPFYLFAIVAWLSDDHLQQFAQRGFTIYSLAILSFLAGSLWGSANVPRGQDKTGRLMISNLFVLLGAAAVTIASPAGAAIVLAALHLAQLAYERATGHDGWYLVLRHRLTFLSMPSYLVFITPLHA